MEKDAKLAADDEENQMKLVVLLTAQQELEVSPNHGGLRPGRLANKNCQRTMSHLLLAYYSITLTIFEEPSKQSEWFSPALQKEEGSTCSFALYIVFGTMITILNWKRLHRTYWILVHLQMGYCYMVSYMGSSCRLFEDYLCMPESTVVESTYMFCASAVGMFGPTYLSAQMQQTQLDSWHRMQR